MREAERWGDEELQDLGRRLPWGALHFRPEAMGTFGGRRAAARPRRDRLRDPLRALVVEVPRHHAPCGWPRTSRGCRRSSTTSTRSPPTGIVGGEQPTAADLQIGATLRVLLTIGDLRPLIEGRPAEQLARRWFADYPGDVPAGAFPAGWVPTA